MVFINTRILLLRWPLFIVFLSPSLRVESYLPISAVCLVPATVPGTPSVNTHSEKERELWRLSLTSCPPPHHSQSQLLPYLCEQLPFT